MIDLGEPRQATVRDSLALLAITFLSALPYISRLGFYSDDWDILGRFDRAAAQGRWPVAEVLQLFPARPVNGLYASLLFEAFGRVPLGYHIVNTTVLAACVVLFYHFLTRLRVGRGEALGAAVIFLILPQLSTIRVWFAAFQITLSLALALASLHFQLSFARSGKPAWGALAVLAAILSIGAYEIFAPLLAGFAIALTIEAARKRGTGNWRPMAIAAVVAVVLALALLFKVNASSRAGSLTQWHRYAEGARQLFRPDYDWRVDSSLNLFAALDTHFWRVIAGWASAAAGFVAGHISFPAIAASAAAAAVAFWRLHAVAEGQSGARLLLLGAATFLLGHALFLIVPAIVFTPTGMGNRVLIAAALGVAMIFAGTITFVARLIFRDRYATPFALSVAVALFFGMLRLSIIEAYWAETPALQRSILESAQRDLASIPAGSTVILDGVCPYHGPGVVFETWWDTGPALSFALNRTLTADVVSPRMEVGTGGIAASIYKQPSLYPYGPRLYAYDIRSHLALVLRNERAAQDYFARRLTLHCPVGYVARGVPV